MDVCGFWESLQPLGPTLKMVRLKLSTSLYIYTGNGNTKQKQHGFTRCGQGANWKGPLGCLMGALHWRFSKHVHLGGHSGIDPGIELIGEIMYLAWECLKVPQEELVNATLSLLPQWSDSGKWKKMDKRIDGWSVTGEYAYILPMVLLYIAFNLNLFFLEAEKFPLWLTVFSKTCWIVPKN